MKIGELAEVTGTAVETIRFYEREALLPPAARAENNYRMYLPEHVERLAFIRRCRTLDMTLDEVRSLLKLRQEPAQSCDEINALLDAHMDHVAHRIKELEALALELKAIRAHCATPRAMADCGILHELQSAMPAESAPTRARRHVHGTH